MSADTAAPASPSFISGLRGWWRADRGAVVQLLGLVGALLSFAALLPSLVRVGGWEPLLGNMALHLYVAVWLLLASAFTRSIGLRDVVVAWLLGMFLVPTLVFLPGIPVRNWLGSTSGVLAVYWAPLLEETALVIALGLLVLRYTRRAGRAPGPLDLFVLGFAVGGGYSVHEDALYGRLLASFPETTIGPAFDATYGWLWPVFTEHDGFMAGQASGLYTYHAGHGAFFGLVFAVVLLLFQRWRPIVWLLPLAWAYAVVEHGLANLMLNTGPLPMRWVFLNGHVIAILLVVAVPACLAFEVWARRRIAVPAPALSATVLRGATPAAAGPIDLLVRLFAALRYHRARNSLVYDAVRRPEPEVAHLRPLEAWARLLAEGPSVIQAHNSPRPDQRASAPPAPVQATPPPAPPPG